jgi:hypothetical protein
MRQRVTQQSVRGKVFAAVPVKSKCPQARLFLFTQEQRARVSGLFIEEIVGVCAP